MFGTNTGKAARFLMVIALITIFSVAASVAVGTSAEPVALFELLEPYVAQYNDYIANIPDLVKQLFDGERINLYINLVDGGEEVIGVAIAQGDSAITEFVAGGLDDPTLRVYIDEAVIREHLANPVQEEILNTLFNLRIEGVGLSNQIEVFVFSLVQRIGAEGIVNRILDFFLGLF